MHLAKIIRGLVLEGKLKPGGRWRFLSSFPVALALYPLRCHFLMVHAGWLHNDEPLCHVIVSQCISHTSPMHLR